MGDDILEGEEIMALLLKIRDLGATYMCILMELGCRDRYY